MYNEYEEMEVITMVKFGERIRALASKIGREEQDIAKDLNLTKSQLSHYINGRRKVPSELLQKIVDIYKINPQFLFDEDAPLYKEKKIKTFEYTYMPTKISAGQALVAESVSEYQTEKITIPNSLMGKWAGNSNIVIMRINGDSMNNIMPHNAIIAVKHVTLSELHDGDIVVYSNDDYEFAVKRFYNTGDKLIFRPDSSDKSFTDHTYNVDNITNLKIHGKVVLYVVELD